MSLEQQTIGVSFPALPTTAADYLSALWKAYVNLKDMPQWLVIYVSPELFKLYKDLCISNYRRTSDWVPFEGEPRLNFRNARVKQDTDLQGHKVRFLEDEYAWKR